MNRLISAGIFAILAFFIIPHGLFSQESGTEGSPRVNPDTINTGGLTYTQSFKSLESRSGEDTETLRYSISSVGINWGSFTGGRLGFASDLNLCIPILIDYKSEETAGFGGFSLSYLGGVGWNLWNDRFGLQPFAGFHANYMMLSKDPIDQNQSNHILSFGLGAGTRTFYTISDKKHIYIAITVNLDTIEFSSASYDSREIKMLNNFTYLISAGYSWSR